MYTQVSHPETFFQLRPVRPPNVVLKLLQARSDNRALAAECIQQLSFTIFTGKCTSKKVTYTRI